MTAAAPMARFLVDQRDWQEKTLYRLHGLRDLFEKRHAWRVERDGWAVANDELRRAVESLQFAEISLDFDDDQIRRLAAGKAAQCEKMITARDGDLSKVEAMLAVYGLELPKPGRESCPKWWRGQLRKICRRGCEALLRDLGYTHKRAGAYVSEYTLRQWIGQQRRNQSILEGLEAVNDDGEAFTLAELAAVNVSNPEIRRGELMTRMRGFEEWAEQDAGQWVPMFYTITTPSKYHARGTDGKRNRKYAGFTPREGADYLQSLWSRARAAVHRQGVQYFGFRIAEPHHDGTPHWHLLLFVLADHKGTLTDTLRDYAFKEDGSEPGAEKHRFEAVEITEEAGTAAGYVAKYVSKNIDGFGVGEDLEVGDFAAITAARVRAWSSVWGIRQFQQLAGPGVTVWRELRRAANNPDRVHMTDQLRLILEPADSGDWCEYTRAMGGAVAAREARPAWVKYETRNLKTWEENRGRYGEPVRRVVGVMGRAFLVISRFREWKIREGSRVSKLAGLAVAGARDLMARVERPVRLNPSFVFADGVRFGELPGAPPGATLDLCQ